MWARVAQFHVSVPRAKLRLNSANIRNLAFILQCFFIIIIIIILSRSISVYPLLY